MTCYAYRKSFDATSLVKGSVIISKAISCIDPTVPQPNSYSVQLNVNGAKYMFQSVVPTPV